MTARPVLHLLSQRPFLTGSGVTLDALVRHAAAAGWDQHVSVGVPAGEALPSVGGLPPERAHPLEFGDGERPYPVPGMSDVMPYESTRFSAMGAAELASYRRGWRSHLGGLIAAVRPALIHAHHVWIMSSMVKDLAPDVPLVVQSHATGLRQMTLCSPEVVEPVRRGCARADAFAVLHRDHAAALVRELGAPPARVHPVGAGYRDDLFHTTGRDTDTGPTLVYVGKYSAAKGLPWLLDAVERLRGEVPGLVLHVAGGGAGPEAEGIADRMRALHPAVVIHGQLAQPALAGLLRRASVCVLPSFYEGVPLVLVEALACGCRLVSTALPGVVDQLAPHLGEALGLVPLPRLIGADVPREDDLPAFVDDLVKAIRSAVGRGAVEPSPDALRPFTWAAVFERVERVWRDLAATAP